MYVLPLTVSSNRHSSPAVRRITWYEAGNVDAGALQLRSAPRPPNWTANAIGGPYRVGTSRMNVWVGPDAWGVTARTPYGPGARDSTFMFRLQTSEHAGSGKRDLHVVPSAVSSNVRPGLAGEIRSSVSVTRPPDASAWPVGSTSCRSMALSAGGLTTDPTVTSMLVGELECPAMSRTTSV